MSALSSIALLKLKGANAVSTSVYALAEGTLNESEFVYPFF